MIVQALVRSTALAGALCASLAVGAAHAWTNRDGRQLPDVDERQSEGDFAAWLLLVADEEEFFRHWQTPAAIVDIETAERVARGDFITALIVFSGCLRDAAGRCNVAVDFRIRNPDGSDYAHIPNQAAWDNSTGPQPGVLVLSQAYVKIRIEPQEFLGEYTVEATVRDVHAEIALLLSASFIADDAA